MVSFSTQHKVISDLLGHSNNSCNVEVSSIELDLLLTFEKLLKRLEGLICRTSVWAC
jgi:hypothetical protein